MSMMTLALTFDGAGDGVRLTPNSITFDRIMASASLYANFHRSWELETVRSGVITITADAARPGAPVRGTLRFSTAARTLETTLQGTMLEVRSF
jgi:hypothetical protein